MSSQMRRIALARRPTGMPVPEDFSLDTGPLPQPKDGEVLVEVTHLSLDPYMRGRMDDAGSYAASVDLGGTMVGQGVGRVVASQAPGFAAGDMVTGMTGWASHAVLPGADLRKLDNALPPSTALGVLGMPGFTAWTGLREYGRPKAGETLVVAAATGPVGSMVGQLAKAAGLRTVAVAGGPEKCRLATETFGFDAAVDHRAFVGASALRTELAKACPDGVDIYWENVGGKVLEAVIPLMNTHGRIPVCGTIAWYGGAEATEDRLPRVWRSILVKRLSVNGFIIFDHWARFPEFLAEVAPKVASGEIAYLEDLSEGLETAPAAFIAMLTGGNTGKQVVKVAD
ncbi:NADP-dependent oxidoreductase [Maliponia aquimaris]|uniref:NADPH-dependent curcumin reductase n=1 Tax=Maliponia aquimaris TaxID=1673631 RepID=A0A238KXE1_9RHOB|nr:NADP-dependent oxidoreductase [Maliponia aquimaris]SMX47358.1 NADPH-dependent curcumin reductase [Maliponia aquimaris]